jgi:tagaturonate epimerase
MKKPVNAVDEANAAAVISSGSLPEALRDFAVKSNIAGENGCSYHYLKKESEKKLLVAASDEASLPDGFTGDKHLHPGRHYLVCDLSPANAAALRSALPLTKPATVGSRNSFGFGDRLGDAGAAHLRSLGDSGFMPVIAQQSIRELDRTRRSAQEVMDAATWAVLQEGYTGGFGADADHLKTFADIDRMMEAGFTMYTIDPSDHVDNRVVEMDENALQKAFSELPWEKLNDTPDAFLKRYEDVTFPLNYDITLQVSRQAALQAAVKYGRVILHTLEMYRYLKATYAQFDSEIELSVDETPHPTTPEEHLIIASELKRLDVELVSLAPRFCGDFEKGIDFKGDIEEFKREYLLHQAIAASYGGYKLSVHSGSDKFQVYDAIGKLGVGTVHVKTAGTSYLEALRAIALTDPGLLREIFAFSLDRFETDRKTYHISADVNKLADPDSYSDDDLPGLLDNNHARQVFHVTFGSVLTEQTPGDSFTYRDRLMKVLSENDKVYEDCLYRHFRKHIQPFENQ